MYYRKYRNSVAQFWDTLYASLPPTLFVTTDYFSYNTFSTRWCRSLVQFHCHLPRESRFVFSPNDGARSLYRSIFHRYLSRLFSCSNVARVLLRDACNSPSTVDTVPRQYFFSGFLESSNTRRRRDLI